MGSPNTCAAMEDDDEIRCAVLTGDDNGGAFSAGANLKNPQTHKLTSTAEFIKSLPKRKDRQFEVLSNFPKPLIGAVNGYAVGVGLHRDLLLRSAAGLGARRMAAAAGGPGDSAGLRWCRSTRSLGWQRARRCGWPWASR